MKRKTIDNSPTGGISIMLVPIDEGNYDFWISITPLHIGFSGKQAVHNLRQAYTNGVVPWGRISMDGQPILTLVIKSLISGNNLKSSVSEQINKILSQNDIVFELASQDRFSPATRFYSEA